MLLNFNQKISLKYVYPYFMINLTTVDMSLDAVKSDICGINRKEVSDINHTMFVKLSNIIK